MYDCLCMFVYFDIDVFVVCFFVYDSDFFENVKLKWILEIRQFKFDIFFFIVGIYIDLCYFVVDIINDCVSMVRGKKCVKKWGVVKYFECSFIDGIGLDEVFWLVYKIVVFFKKK